VKLCILQPAHIAESHAEVVKDRDVSRPVGEQKLQEGDGAGVLSALKLSDDLVEFVRRLSVRCPTYLDQPIVHLDLRPPAEMRELVPEISLHGVPKRSRSPRASIWWNQRLIEVF